MNKPWDKTIAEMPGQFLHGQNPLISGRAYSVFYNMDGTWTIFMADKHGYIREIGTHQAEQLMEHLKELGFEIPLDWQDQQALQLPYHH